MKKRGHILFSKKYSRLTILKTILQWPIDHLLRSQTRKHIAKNKKQLVIFSFDHIGHQINLNGVYEFKELDTFFDWIGQYGKVVFNGAAIDIGANIGNHSLYFSDYFETVYSFEPNLRTYKVLMLNSELATNITCFNVGISNLDRQALLNVNPSNIGGSRISEVSSTHSQRIELRTLDSLMSHAENIRLIKLDVEGHEYEALLGSETIIKKHKPIVLFEQSSNDFTEGQSRVINLLKQFGYSQFALIQNYPRAPNSLNSITRYSYAAISRVIFGASMRVILQNEIEPFFYPFIVAIPDWLNVSPLTAQVFPKPAS